MKLLILTVLLMCCVAICCAWSGELPAVVELAPGESAEVGNEGLLIGFDGITMVDGFLMDSRCPSSVVCVWAGDAAVDVWAELPGEDRVEIVLHTHSLQGPQEFRIGGYSLRLSNVAPYPVEPGSIPAELYRLSLSVEVAARVNEVQHSWTVLKDSYRD